MPGSFHNFFEHLINLSYQHHREKLSRLYGKVHDLATSYIRFGGWEINYNGKGWSRLFLEKVGGINFVSKTIYLNINYTYRLAGLPVSSLYSFPDLLNSVSHELAHCLLGDFNLTWANKHDEDHLKLTKEIEKYLWTLAEVQELERLDKLFSKSSGVS
ncbi:MAG: hypothetical protein MRECE_9c021 [Mycoplasmataceae bacterium CE_OT135]|nr:MAG: hypothetical protein MRECE_9c021 [Mycoplasmataceae bacterium CE_OT135]